MAGVGAAFAVGRVSNAKEEVAATMVTNERWRGPSELKTQLVGRDGTYTYVHTRTDRGT